MTPYAKLNRQSGVSAYEIGEGYIIVEFERPTKNGKRFYEYTNTSIGSSNVQIMHSLARQGEGLNSFISSNEEIKYGYARSW